MDISVTKETVIRPIVGTDTNITNSTKKPRAFLHITTLPCSVT
jgi:hypothetical protein